MSLPREAILFDAKGMQDAGFQDRGIARYSLEQINGVLRHAPDAVQGIGLDEQRPVPRALEHHIGTGLLEWLATDRPPRATPPQLLHVLSPFEIARPVEELWPAWARTRRTALVMTFYDLIPLVFEHHYLQDPWTRANYLARLDVVRAADHLLAISERTAADAVELLRVPEDRITVVHAGVSSAFAADELRDDVAERLVADAQPRIRPGFLLYVGGIEFRKNIERLIEAHAAMPAAARAAHQLVITCKVEDDERRRLERRVRDLGLNTDDVVLTGFVSDEVLHGLYRRCRLFVFPSFYEGSGLPILEAMAAGAPVAAAAAATTPEILGDDRATFDPFDVGDIARVLAATLADDAMLDVLRARSAERHALHRYTWDGVAEQTIVGYERALAGRARRISPRPRIAWWSPWPPDASGVATYSSRLVPALAKAADVDVITAGPRRDHPQSGLRIVGQLPEAAEAVQPYDHVVYSIGNSDFHHHVLRAMRRRRGLVLLHDVRLVGLYRSLAMVEHPHKPTPHFASSMDVQYGDRFEAGYFWDRFPTPEEEHRLRILMTREVQEHADAIVVHSHHAADLLRLDRRPGVAGAPVHVLPHAARAPRAPREPGEVRTIVSMGILSEVKGLAQLIDAFALVAPQHPELRLVLGGGGSEQELRRWREHADRAGVGGAVEITGFLEDDAYERLVERADIAVQLRTTTNGEASGAVTDCLVEALPTIVTDDGWARELPADAVMRVASNGGAAALAAVLRELLDDPLRRRALSEGAVRYVESISFDAVAEQYLALLGID